MVALTNFTPQDAEKVIGLPLKIGVWIGSVEDEAGSLDDGKERHALLAALKSIGRDKARPPFVHDVCRETLEHQARWKGWSKAPSHELPDIAQAVKAVEANASADDSKAYKAMLYDIAEAVAMAYGEFGLVDESMSKSNTLNAFLDKCLHRLSVEKEQGSPQNLSAGEQDALLRLRAALGLDEA